MTQRSLTALRIGNFKAFADTQRIPLKPITLIFGPNSAGKSSIIHSLAFAHEAEFGRDQSGTTRLDVHRTSIGGSSIDLGGFRQFVHGGKASLRMEWGAEIDVARSESPLRELLGSYDSVDVTLTIGVPLDDQDRPVRGASPFVETMKIAFKSGATIDNGPGVLIEMSYRQRERALRIDRMGLPMGISNALLALATVKRELLVTHWPDRQRIVDVVATVCSAQENVSKAQVMDMLDKLQDKDLGRLMNESMPQLLVQLDGLLPSKTTIDGEDLRAHREALRRVVSEKVEASIEDVFHTCVPIITGELITRISGELSSNVRRLKYLGPVRERPNRHVAFPERRGVNWQAGGAFAWDVLINDDEVRERVSQWLGGHPGLTNQQVAAAILSGERRYRADNWAKTTYRLFVDRHVSVADLRDALASAFYEKPLTLLQRRELLTKNLAQVYASLQEQYETDQARAEEYAQELQPWIERIQTATSAEERERLTEEAMEQFRQAEERKADSSEAMQEMYSEQMAEDAPIEQAQTRAAEFLMALENRDVADIKELRLWDVNKRTAVSVGDVGFGISQVLPVLTLAYGSEGRVIAIEQPEIHLHPALQAELGDVFIESATGERQNTFVLETHSEHLILRLLRRVREKKISPADMCVLFVEPTDHGSQVRELEYDESGDFIDEWPGGFFEEAFREKFAGR